MLAQAGEALGERCRLPLDALGCQPRKAPERADDEPQRAVAVDGQHPDDDRERCRDDAGEDRGGARPAFVRQPWRGAEVDDQDREHVVGAFDDDRADDLGCRRRRALRERHDPGGLPGTRRHDVVEQVADHRRGHHGAPRGPAAGGEQRAPAHPAQHRLHGERHHRRHEPPGVAALQRAPRLVPVHAPDGEVGEDGASVSDLADTRAPGRAPPAHATTGALEADRAPAGC